MIALLGFILIVAVMWLFILRNCYLKLRYRKREKWVKLFTSLAEDTPYMDIYEDLIDSCYEYKGTVYEMIATSHLPENEKMIATQYFYSKLENIDPFFAGKKFNYLVWGISVVVMLLFYVCFLNGDISSDADVVSACLILVVVNFIAQITCFSVRGLVFMIMECRGFGRKVNGKLEKGTRGGIKTLSALYNWLDNLFSR